MPHLHVSGRANGAGHAGFPDVTSCSPSWYREQECAMFSQESAEKPEMEPVEKNQLNTEQLCLSQSALSWVTMSLQTIVLQPRTHSISEGLLWMLVAVALSC